MMKHSDHSDNLSPRVNLLDKSDNTRPRGKKIFRLSKFILYLFIIMIIAFFVFSYQVLFTNNSMGKIFAGDTGFFSQLRSLAGSEAPLKGEAENRINILLLGMGGAGHDGPYLTDTIILASFQPSSNQVSMFSIPRDLLVEIPGYGYWKINNANAFGEQKDENNGADITKQVVANTFDLPVHYYVRIDFSGFEKIIDEIDGIKVEVDRSFTDYQYPTNDHKHQVVSFEQGFQTMDGDTALKYVRSRHGNNGEGSDFARSARQQKVIQAFKNRILSYNFLLNPNKIKKVSTKLSEHLRTDMEFWELLKFAKIFKDINMETVTNHVLDDSPGGYLYPSIVNQAYVLKPRGEDFSQIQFLIKNIFNENVDTGTVIIQDDETPQLPSQNTTNRIIKIEVRNGTTTNGLASQNSQALKLKGYRITKIGNADNQEYTQTQIYRMSPDKLEEESKELTEYYSTPINHENIPQWVKDNSAPDLDFFIILGTDK
jgi:polyisoprenyl-teichoic acid--peptidoglycan teichoic acid transferase